MHKAHLHTKFDIPSANYLPATAVQPVEQIIYEQIEIMTVRTLSKKSITILGASHF